MVFAPQYLERRYIPSNVMKHWIAGLVKLLMVWLGPDLQLEKSKDEVMSSVVNLSRNELRESYP